MASRKRGPGTEATTSLQNTNKKIKVATIWEWEDDGGVWKAYSEDIAKQITEALENRDTKFVFVLGNSKFEINFSMMVQKNTKTCWERRIRAIGSSGSPVEVQEWEFNEEHGKWRKFTQGLNQLLCTAEALSIPKVCIKKLGQIFEFDLSKMTQTHLQMKQRKSIRKVNSQRADVTGNSVPSEEIKEKVKAVSSEEADTTVKSFAFKGKAPVDQECPSKGQYHVFVEGEVIWDAMLNQTNLKNNNNKYYLLQLLEKNASKSYAIWFRWGRVGKTGQNNFTTFGSDLQSAKDTFTKKFCDKTLNDWETKDDFEKVAGKYDLLKMDYGTSDKENDTVDGTGAKNTTAAESLLDEKLQKVIEMICNVQNMEDILMEMKYDSKKAPLGKLTKDQIKAGYEALKEIENCIKKKVVGDRIIKACDSFYTRIPHCFGMQRPPIIGTKEQVHKKLELLEALGDIEIAMTVLSENEDMRLHPLDRHYKALSCELDVISHNCDEFQVIEKYLQNTHAPTHSHYRMEIEEIFKCKHYEQEKQFLDYGNRYLLWHGSRLTNWVGILKEGLRVAPPEAPVTGYMFGKGVYFADMSSKSANYCFATKRKNIGFLLLSEVSLGKPNELLAADYEADKLPPGCHSVKGLGKFAPLQEMCHSMPDGLKVPLGKVAPTGVVNQSGYTLNYNEFVVYDTRQIKSRYLLQVKFCFT